MAEPIGRASGIFRLSAFAFTSSASLHQAVQSFQSNDKTVRALTKELEDLEAVIQPLRRAISTNETDLEPLKLPLYRCGRACEEFEAMITNSKARSDGRKPISRDWTQLKYMGDDLHGFKKILAGYKSTIFIALADINFRTNTVTTNVLKEYKEMITKTTSNLGEHLRKIDQELQMNSSQDTAVTNPVGKERDRLQEEKDSTEQSLRVCAMVSDHIDQAELNKFEDISTSSNGHRTIVSSQKGPTSAKQAKQKLFKESREKLNQTASELERYLEEVNSRLQRVPSQAPRSSDDDMREQHRMREEREGIQQCLAICAEASEQANKACTNVLEDVSAAQDAQQVVVATLGDLISARRVTAVDKSTQWLGQMSDDTVQQLSRDRNCSLVDKAAGSRSAIVTTFKDRYGMGKTLD